MEPAIEYHEKMSHREGVGKDMERSICSELGDFHPAGGGVRQCDIDGWACTLEPGKLYTECLKYTLHR
jgi:hypothetical protein